MARYQTVSLSGLSEGRFKSCINPDAIYPNILHDVSIALGCISGYALDRELVISMPRLEEITTESVNLSSESKEEDGKTIGEDFRKYLSLLNQFNNYVGQGAEELLINLLNSTSGRLLWYPTSLFGDFERLKFIRNSVQFPDVHLIDTKDNTILLSIESKTWFLFSADKITARFHIAPPYISNNTLLVIFPWAMSKLISGSPIIFKPYVCSAKALATLRDNVWSTGGMKEFKRGAAPNPNRLKYSDVNHVFSNRVNNHNIKSTGYQEKVVGGVSHWEIETDNFGKIWRIYDDSINKNFRNQAYSNTLLGKSIQEWRNELKF